MRLVFAGTPAAALPSLGALLASPHEVIAVLTRPDAPAGRGKALRASPVAEVARAAGVEVLTPDRPSNPALLARLTELAPDCCPIVAYGGLIPPPVLAVPAAGWVNLHFSLLPAWRGAAPVQHAVLAGDDLTGATTFRLDEGLDTGPVFGFATEPIGPADTAGDVLDRLAASGARLLLATLDGIADGRLAPMPQPAEGVSHAPKLAPADVRIDWSAPALRIDRLSRAATPVPGAWTRYGDRRIKLGPVGAVRGDALAPGEIRLDRALGVLVGTGTHPVALSSVRAEGKPAMAAADWARGARPAAGASFT
ncbi:MAG: methionyl-tRNA formyltransferase [Actinomycetota bacterium]|nr:methionyl-tRNA formyltransferase [Actinomycetota bacterium]